VAFQYPELFSRVGGHSGYFYEGDFPENNPYNLAATAPGIEGLAMYLDYGADDRIVNGLVEDFAAQLRTQRNIDPLFLLNPAGGHDNAYWAEQSPAYLAWYAQEWPRTIDIYPTCEDA
jgi:enterochelin esterase-like enzyme